MRAAQSPAHSVSPSHAGRITPGARALDRAFSPIEAREGVRIGLLGDPGSGKTYAAKCIVAEYLRRSRGLVIVADSKGEGGWPGVTFRSVAAVAGAGALADRRVVLTPDPFAEPLDLEEVARFQWSLAQRGCASLAVWDELSDACRGGEWLDGVSILPRTFTHGRRVGVSALWGAQFAQLIPHEPYETSTCLFVWRQAGNALAILRRRGYTDPSSEAVIRDLPGDSVPPSERGAFVMLVRGRPWDGLVYRF